MDIFVKQCQDFLLFMMILKKEKMFINFYKIWHN